MPRIRSIKPDFWTSEKIATRLPGSTGRLARLLFIALWNLAEDHGVARGSPAFLRSAAFPYDEDVTAGDVSACLDLLEQGAFIRRYQANGSSYVFILGFAEHQKIDRPSKTTFPAPPSEPSEPTPQVLAEPSPSPRGTLVAGGEGKGEEGKGEEGTLPSASPPEVPEHEDPTPPLAPGTHDAPRKADSPRAEQAREVFAYWQQVLGHPRAKLGRPDRKRIEDRLEEGHSVQDLKRVVDGCAASDWHMGRDPKNPGKRFDSLELLFRNAGKVAEFMARAPEQGPLAERPRCCIDGCEAGETVQQWGRRWCYPHLGRMEHALPDPPPPADVDRWVAQAGGAA